MTHTALAPAREAVAAPTTLVARVGRWCFRRRWLVLAGWLVAVVGGVFSAGPVFASLDQDRDVPSVESLQGDEILDANSTSAGTLVAVISGVDPRSGPLKQVVDAAATDLSALGGVATVLTPYSVPPEQAGALIAKDQRGILVAVRLGPLPEHEGVEARAAVVTRLRALHPALTAAAVPATVEVGGGSLINQQANGQVQDDLALAERLSLPLTLLILTFVFGGIVAAGVPVLGAIVSIAGSFGVLLVFTTMTDLNNNAITVVTLLGLGLSVDYGLLLVARYRDELAAGHAPPDAVARAWATAGRTILFSGLTVAAALSGLLVFGVSGLSALGAAGISITLVSIVVAMTFTAALLGVAGRRIRPSRRALARTSGGFFDAVARLVQRRPLVTALTMAIVLFGAGWPLLTMKIQVSEFDALPRSLEAVHVADVLADQYGRAPTPTLTVVARTDPSTLDQWATRYAGSADVAEVHPAEAIGPGLARIDLDAVGEPEGDAALRLVDAIRANRPDGGESWVVGQAAFHRDFIDRIVDRLPYALGLTVGAMVILLFLMTGSLIVPIKAVIMNVVSLGASFGVLDAVFQHGVLSGLLQTTTVAAITPFVLVTVFAFAFGLSMDYEVFLLARIKEQVDQGQPNDEAIRRGLQSSGRVITSAALLLVIVFGCFLVARIGTVQQIGLGLAVAVAVDATLVRCLLVPATMTLMGRWNWWAPAPLARLHRRLGLAH